MLPCDLGQVPAGCELPPRLPGLPRSHLLPSHPPGAAFQICAGWLEKTTCVTPPQWYKTAAAENLVTGDIKQGLPFTPASLPTASFVPVKPKQRALQALGFLGQREPCCLARCDLEEEVIKTCSQALLTPSKPHHTCKLGNGKREAAFRSPEAERLFLPVIPKFSYATLLLCSSC